MQATLLKIFYNLSEHFGAQHWWPAKTGWEIVVGAILTQNTAWVNVERAIANLRRARKLTLKTMGNTPRRVLARLIRPAGYYNQKAGYLKDIAGYFLSRWPVDWNTFFARPVEVIRQELLSLSGVGPETADSILLYLGKKPIFVIDAYTRRFGERYPLFCSHNYSTMQNFFSRYLPPDEKLFNEYHALLVALGKHYCRPNPQCPLCPLHKQCQLGRRKRYE